MKKFAFTLSEILITIGIIGIVAALTIPALINSYNKLQTVNKLKSAYGIFSEVIKLSVADHGDISGWNVNLNTNDFAAEYILPYLKGTSVTTRYTMRTMGINDYYYLFWPNKIYQMQNGMTFAVSQSNGPVYKLIIVDINGPKAPNRLGIDGFVFQILHDSNKFSPSGITCSREDILAQTGCSYYNACKRSSNWQYYVGSHCTGLIIKDNWKISKDYPWNNGK